MHKETMLKIKETIVGLSTGLIIGLSSSLLTQEVNVVPVITLPATVIDIHDGDTLKVRTSFDVQVRLLDTWCPELKEAGGKESLENLHKNCPIGSKVVLQVPFSPDITRMFSFGRVLGRVHKDGSDVGKLQIKEGFAKEKK